MRIVFVILVFVAFTISCKKSKNCEEAQPNCAAVECFAHWDYFDFKLVDKTTGADLVFGANPRYAATDIKLFFDSARTYPINLITDSTNKKLLTMTARQEMYLEIKGTDVYKLTVEFRGQGCCETTVKNLWQDGRMICACCTDVIPLAVR
jgi:hypothetical protein